MPAIILVRPGLPENVGAAARVMANFGLDDLRLVAPALPPDHPQAVAVATHGAPVLANATIFPDLREALADRQRVWATAARGHRRPAEAPRPAMARLRQEEREGLRTALVFGPERTGLGVEELSLADGVIRIPTTVECPALNLAQAVAVLSWEWASAEPTAPTSPPPPAPADRAALHALFDHLEQSLDAAGFLPSSHRVPMVHGLRALLLRAELSEQEVRTLRGAIRALSGAGQRSTVTQKPSKPPR